MSHWTKKDVVMNVIYTILLVGLISYMEMSKTHSELITKVAYLFATGGASYFLLRPFDTSGPWYLARGISFFSLIGVVLVVISYWLFGLMETALYVSVIFSTGLIGFLISKVFEDDK